MLSYTEFINENIAENTRRSWERLKSKKSRIKFLVDKFGMDEMEAEEIVTPDWRNLPKEIKNYFEEK